MQRLINWIKQHTPAGRTYCRGVAWGAMIGSLESAGQYAAALEAREDHSVEYRAIFSWHGLKAFERGFRRGYSIHAAKGE